MEAVYPALAAADARQVEVNQGVKAAEQVAKCQPVKPQKVKAVSQHPFYDQRKRGAKAKGR